MSDPTAKNDPSDLLEAADRYLELSRRWRGRGEALSMDETRELTSLMRRLERALAGAADDGEGARPERRMALRVPTYVAVQYKAASCTVGGGLVELSDTGAFIRVDHPPSPGTRLCLQLVPDGGGASVDLIAEVMWTREASDARGPAGMGIRFEDVSPAQCHFLVELMGEALVARLLDLEGRPLPSSRRE